jgi:hypothetical protein
MTPTIKTIAAITAMKVADHKSLYFVPLLFTTALEDIKPLL